MTATATADEGYDPNVKWPDANCLSVPPEYMFPGNGDDVEGPRSVCIGTDGWPECPRLAACLKYALEHNERFGVWGGTTQRQRARMLRRIRGVPEAKPAPGHAYR